MSVNFAHPLVLLLLLVPAALAAWEITRRGLRVPLPLYHPTPQPRRS